MQHIGYLDRIYVDAFNGKVAEAIENVYASTIG